jgi:uncharacterized repeat protein (TIGR01451 family)
MKKVLVFSFLVFLVLLAGCKGTDRALGPDESKPAVTTSGTSFFWDKDLRPAVAVPSRLVERPRVSRAGEQQPAAPGEDQMTAPVESIQQLEPITPPTTTQPELVTASVEEMQPVTTEFVAPTRTYEKVMPGTGLIAVDDAGGHVLSMTYPRPDYGIIQIDKTMPKEIRLNDPFTYIIKVTNLTDMMLTDVVITETLSKEFTFKGSDPTALTEGNRLVWEINSLGPKANKSIKISGLASDTDKLEHCTAITHTMRDCAVVAVVQPTLELTKIAPSEALLCEPITVEFIVTNTGTGAAQNVQIVDTLPAGLQTADGKGKVVLDAGTLAAQESRRFAIKLRATKNGVYVNKAVATSASGLRAESEATLTSVRQPILAISKSGPQRQYLGRPISYEITVVNKGDGPARNTIIEDIIPPGVTAIEATTGAQFSTSKLVWELGTLEPNMSKKVQVSYTPTKEGEVMATASASAYCAETVTDTAKTAITGIAAARLEVVDLEDPVEVGNTTTYVITVTNQGSAADTNVRVVCTLDDKLQYVSSAGATAGSIMGRTVSFAPLRRLEPRTKATWRVVVRGARAGDVRFKATMHTDTLALPVEQTEATHVYQQYGVGN